MSYFKDLDLTIFHNSFYLDPETIQCLRNAIHRYLSDSFSSLHDSFPRPDEMFVWERKLLKFECYLDRFLSSRGFKIDAEQEISRV